MTDQFIHLVAEMREEQKAYFKFRTPDHLQKAKKLEAQVDAELANLTGETPNKTEDYQHPTLF